MPILPMFPLGGVVLPGESLPLHVFEDRYQKLLADCLASPAGPLFGVVLIERGSEVGGGEMRQGVGVRTRIVGHRGLGPGRFQLDCLGEHRIRVTRWLADDPYPLAEVEDWPDTPTGPPQVEVTSLLEDITHLYGRIDRLAERQNAVSPPPPKFENLPADPGDLLYALATQVPMGQADRLSILSAPGAQERAAALTDAIAGVLAIVEFQLTE
ncbi:LON peptidase substrate-binding domain-containing protein [Tomitella biformata]|uniref:LON peptidase substrate-binding domain-containing protein n=1 Tax=Tomitella biformata TaxID=630403 RepID=UPI000465E784|nr:LON peptidase substrate-binding domain-containing protein [Tomitella biformata]